MGTDGISRRGFLTTLGVAGATATAAGMARAQPPAAGEEFHGLLVDTTRCIGCRSCEVACARSKGLPTPDLGPDAVDQIRTTTPNELTVVNRHATGTGYIFLKQQCMHCNQPACASACLTKAMLKTHAGPVVWRSGKCMGCRMCMLSCPFDVPKFQYDRAVPSILKCDLCNERRIAGQAPVCVEACPAGALKAGPRRELLEEARHRIAANPGQYVDHIYGENEAGGTGVMYLSAVPFAELGLRNVGKEAFPELSRPFLQAVPLIFVLFPPLMLALSKATSRKPAESEEEAQ